MSVDKGFKMKDQHRPAGFHNVHVRPTVDHIDQENRSRNNCLNVYFTTGVTWCFLQKCRKKYVHLAKTSWKRLSAKIQYHASLSAMSLGQVMQECRQWMTNLTQWQYQKQQYCVVIGSAGCRRIARGCTWAACRPFTWTVQVSVSVTYSLRQTTRQHNAPLGMGTALSHSAQNGDTLVLNIKACRFLILLCLCSFVLKPKACEIITLHRF